jgi:hypothetical protein
LVTRFGAVEVQKSAIGGIDKGSGDFYLFNTA